MQDGLAQSSKYWAEIVEILLEFLIFVIVYLNILCCKFLYFTVLHTLTFCFVHRVPRSIRASKIRNLHKKNWAISMRRTTNRCKKVKFNFFVSFYHIKCVSTCMPLTRNRGFSCDVISSQFCKSLYLRRPCWFPLSIVWYWKKTKMSQNFHLVYIMIPNCNQVTRI